MLPGVALRAYSLGSISVDDYGHAFTPNNRPDVNMPTLNSLASTGLVIENFYTYQFCSPSRAAFLTGTWKGGSRTRQSCFSIWLYRQQGGTLGVRHLRVTTTCLRRRPTASISPTTWSRSASRARATCPTTSASGEQCVRINAALSKPLSMTHTQTTHTVAGTRASTRPSSPRSRAASTIRTASSAAVRTTLSSGAS